MGTDVTHALGYHGVQSGWLRGESLVAVEATLSTWSWVLTPMGADHTRLVTRLRIDVDLHHPAMSTGEDVACLNTCR